MDFVNDTQWWIYLIVAILLLVIRFIFTQVLESPDSEFKEDANKNPMVYMFGKAAMTLSMLVPLGYMFMERNVEGFIAILAIMIVFYGSAYWFFKRVLKKTESL